MTDQLGNELKVGDAVVFPSSYLVGNIIAINDGAIARGLSISGQPQAEAVMPHIIIKAEIQRVIPALGGPPQVVKVQTPEAVSAGPET